MEKKIETTRVRIGVLRDNGKQNGNYYSNIAFRGIYWGGLRTLDVKVIELS